MKKQDLLDALDFMLQSYAFGMLAPTLVPAREWERLAAATPKDPAASGVAPLRDEAVRVARTLQDPARRPVLLDLHRESLKRTLLADAHEALLTYTVATGQFEKYRAAPFWAFARVVRGTMGARSGGVLREWPRDLAAEGVRWLEWRERLVEATQVGMPIPFSHPEALRLFQDYAEFARDNLV